MEERNLFDIAQKNALSPTRSCKLFLMGNDDNNDHIIDQYREILLNEYEAKYLNMIELINTYLISNDDDDDEFKSHYSRMRSDLYTFLLEIRPTSEEYGKELEKYIKYALKVAESLSVLHPTRLGLILNSSVQYYEILKQHRVAYDMARDAFDAAYDKLDTLSGPNYKDSTLIMQLLRDNCKLWNQDGQQVKIRRVIVDGYLRRVWSTLNLSDNITTPANIITICTNYYFTPL